MRTHTEKSGHLFEQLVAKAFGRTATIVKSLRLKSSSLSEVQVLKVRNQDSEFLCVAKSVHWLWRREPTAHKIASIISPTLVPRIITRIRAGGLTGYLTEYVDARVSNSWTENDVRLAVKMMCNFYNKSVAVKIPRALFWLSPNLKCRDLSKELGLIISKSLAEKRILSNQNIEDEITSTIQHTRDCQKYLVHNDLYADQFILASNGMPKLVDWGFLSVGHPFVDVLSLLRADPDGRNTCILPYRRLWLQEFSECAPRIFGERVEDTELDVWAKWQCLRDILWFKARISGNAQLEDPMSDWLVDSSREFQFLVLNGPGAWALFDPSKV